MEEQERLERLWKLADLVMDRLREALEAGGLNPQGLKHISATMKDIKDIQMLKDPSQKKEEDTLTVKLEEALQRLSE